MADKRGLLAFDWRLRVTQPPKVLAKVAIIPCQAGWKQQDGTWENEWITVKTFSPQEAANINKGDTIMVDGRVVKERNGEYLNWVVLADAVRCQHSTPSPQPATEPASGPAFPTGASNMDDVPF